MFCKSFKDFFFLSCLHLHHSICLVVCLLIVLLHFFIFLLFYFLSTNPMIAGFRNVNCIGFYNVQRQHVLQIDVFSVILYSNNLQAYSPGRFFRCRPAVADHHICWFHVPSNIFRQGVHRENLVTPLLPWDEDGKFCTFSSVAQILAERDLLRITNQHTKIIRWHCHFSHKIASSYYNNSTRLSFNFSASTVGYTLI